MSVGLTFKQIDVIDASLDVSQWHKDFYEPIQDLIHRTFESTQERDQIYLEYVERTLVFWMEKEESVLRNSLIDYWTEKLEKLR